MVVIEDPDEQHFDDVTMGLQLQQFMDEWHYRVLHSSLASTWDRNETVVKALELFEFCGIEFGPGEMDELANMEEGMMVERIVKKMDLTARKTFEHFALQLQLVVSTATRVRYVLENGDEAETARAMDDADTGVTSQILKLALIEAGREVAEIRSNNEGWKKNTDSRVGRLVHAAGEAEHLNHQLMAVQSQLGGFAAEQSAKSKSVLMGMSDKNDKMLLTTCFSSWEGITIKERGVKDIHDMFKRQIENAEAKLAEYKARNLRTLKGVLTRNAAAGDKGLQSLLLNAWLKTVQEEKGDAEAQEKMKQLNEKLAHTQQSQKENTKKVMARMAAGSDANLTNLCLQAWIQFIEEYNKNKAFEDQVKKTEQALKDHMAKKSEEAKGVLARMNAATSTGLLASCISEWYKVMRFERYGEDMGGAAGDLSKKLENLNVRFKSAAKNVSNRANKADEENFLLMFFTAWNNESRTSGVVRHYATKMDAKKNQLDAVQNMFKQFSAQLEKGMGTSPRGAGRRETRVALGLPKSDEQLQAEEGKGRPPQMP
eukprot:gnl/TRDRNA2_/TRDRNA2_164676_c0_seq2.p1 gnl/TRDRNA2_/TRDRNA2_164676_c0~~gnl/TRDRNA2_/TRDRNA2_164676_c0_seq2.p1  ORF type:complete len:542 (+),score=157.46 gnl/TRDRNA2_/TRDRNA2_164676_c0_seq2:70-1695(+)